ncbi:SnoaL-like domain-containing protein [Iamia sp. SCSIO 61187]|uniref:nuclear transport factor 2 family protein n=1 Tax=Iamia sp. SCSIO 61187 TaxID=2722752 RepID=UPI001C62E5FA|nr:nuclear transport factor 2 family protein [Iamia sp. SCSIO 61187]QYG95092.1 SnoaL-like domain-containing protein [Iamia sp. SCSIO 61187]
MDAGEGVRALLARYGERMDAGDFDGVGALFADGCLRDEHGAELARGSEAVARFYRSITRLHDGSPRTTHLVLGTWLADPDADGVITARSSYLVLQAVDPGALVPMITGSYVDRVAPEADGAWRFLERRFHVALTGDLNRHLTFEL